MPPQWLLSVYADRQRRRPNMYFNRMCQPLQAFNEDEWRGRWGWKPGRVRIQVVREARAVILY
jgi:hypothetical protein